MITHSSLGTGLKIHAFSICTFSPWLIFNGWTVGPTEYIYLDSKLLASLVIYNPNNPADYSAKVLGDYNIKISCPPGLRIPQIYNGGKSPLLTVGAEN